MYSRLLILDLEKHIPAKQITVVTGLRRVGKTTILKHLISKIESSNKIFLDFEKAENRLIFNQERYADIEASLSFSGIDFKQKAYIAIDEIQLVKSSTSVIKYLYDTYDIKFFVTGSSSFYLKNHFSESLAGRKRIFNMYPLSFEEFLGFKGIELKDGIPKSNRFNVAVYQKLNESYREYLAFGGFPEVALCNNRDDKKAYLSDIVNSYLQMDLLISADIERTDEIYALVKLLSTRVGSRMDYSKLASVAGLSRHKIKEYLAFMEHTFFIKLLNAHTTNVDKEISLQKKLYFADNGLLAAFGITDIGKLLENSIANQLQWNETLAYYTTKAGQEIDFVVNGDTTIEVKETATYQDLKTLQHRSSNLGIDNHYLVGLNAPVNGFLDFTWAGTL